MRVYKIGVIIFFIAVLVACNKVEPIVCEEGYENVDGTCQLIEDEELVCNEDYVKIDETCILIDSIIEEMVNNLSLEEKAGQMIQTERGSISLEDIANYNIGSILSGGGSKPGDTYDDWTTMITDYQNAALSSSSGIPLIYGIDAVHGNNNFLGATIFPHNIGLGAANNPSLMYEIGQATAEEMKAVGITWNFAPTVAIVQDISWGRTYESYSERYGIVNDLSIQYILGLEQNGVSATAKHYLGDGVTNGGIDQGNVIISEDLLRDIYLQPYIEAIEIGVDTIMASFSSINGEKMHGSYYWLQEVLKDELGFEGYIISDWEAVGQLPGGFYEDIVQAVNAGVDQLMEPYRWYDAYNAIINAVNNGDITEERIDDAVFRILKVKYERGLFDNPIDFLDESYIRNQEHIDIAEQAVRESLVLLKNDNLTLPLAAGTKIAIIGPGADNIGLQSGGWTYTWQGIIDPHLLPGVSILQGFKNVFGIVNIVSPEEADVIIAVFAEIPYAEGMGDNDDLGLITGSTSHSENLNTLNTSQYYSNIGTPVIGILLSGRPLILDNYIDTFDAYVAAWLPGSEAGNAIAEVFIGDYDFVGKLSFSWPIDNSQLGYNSNSETYNPEDFLYPYGYGLTYND